MQRSTCVIHKIKVIMYNYITSANTKTLLPLSQLILPVFVTIIANQIKATADKMFNY